MNSGSASSSSPARPTTAGSCAGNAAGAPADAEEFHFPSELISVHDRKDQALHVLKSDLMDALNKEVKSLDEDSWMFEGPRSRINLMSKPVETILQRMKLTGQGQCGFLPKQMDHSGKDLSSLNNAWR